MKELALRKLNEGLVKLNGSRHIEIMKRPVYLALCEFCEQNEEFAQAVMQGGSFEECMNAVAKNVGSAISDLDAYRRAVQFYFPGADINFQMTIKLCEDDVPEAVEHTEEGAAPVVLDLFDLLG